MRPYPTRKGLPISPIELGYGGEAPRLNNHHSAWSSRTMSRMVLTQTFRDLSSMQDLLPITRHNSIHSVFDPPALDLRSVYHYVIEAYEQGEELRRGTAYNPMYSAILPEMITIIHQEMQQAA